ncbi:hypothetical protein [Shewanella carassii]|nr:hypothetical protein [Shewanella carassii]
MSKKSNDKGLTPMKSSTRFWFLEQFGNARGGIDYEKAAQFCCVKPRTVRYWWTTSCPPWIDRLAHLASRAIPDTRPWRECTFVAHPEPGFSELLVLPNGKKLSAGDLYLYADNLDLMREYRVKTEKAAGQLEAVRSEEEAAAICAELDHMVRSIEKLKLSPILTRTGKYNEPVAKAKGRADKSGVAVSRKK